MPKTTSSDQTQRRSHAVAVPSAAATLPLLGLTMVLLIVIALWLRAALASLLPLVLG